MTFLFFYLMFRNSCYEFMKSLYVPQLSFWAHLLFALTYKILHKIFHSFISKLRYQEIFESYH